MDAPPGVIRSQTDTSSYAVRQTRPLSERSRAPVTHGAALGSPRGTYLETLRTEAEARLDAVEAKIDAVIAALKAAGLMAS